MRSQSRKVKQFLYRPEQTLRGSEGWDYQISWHSAHAGSKFVIPRAQPPLPPPPGNITGTLFLLEAESTPWPWWGRKKYVNEKFQWHLRHLNHLCKGFWRAVDKKSHNGLVTKPKVVTLKFYILGLSGTYLAILNISRTVAWPWCNLAAS